MCSCRRIIVVMGVVKNDRGDGHGDHDCSKDDHGNRRGAHECGH